LASTAYVAAAVTNQLPSITNGLASIIYVNAGDVTATNQADTMVRITFTNWPCFKVRSTTNGNIDATVVTHWKFNTVAYEKGQSTGFGWDSSNWRYRPPVAGVYRFSFAAYVKFPAGAAAQPTIGAYTNLVTTGVGGGAHFFQTQPPLANDVIAAGSITYKLATNDTVTCGIYVGPTGTVASAHTHFEGELISPD
jgi:hypothetical protein